MSRTEKVTPRTLAVLVENRPGVLTHVAGLISRRGYNIASIAASTTEEPDITRLSIVVEVESDEELEQIVAQLRKLIQVVKVVDLTSADHLMRELALIKVKASPDTRAEIVNVADIFRARVIDVHPDTMVLELTGETPKIDAFCKLMEKHGIVEIIRTGQIFLDRSSKSAIQAEEE